MKTRIIYRDLVKMKPCYHPNDIGIKNGYSATIPEFIKEYRDKVKNKEDIIWVICRNDYMTDKDLRLFAVWCAREALKLIFDPDPRSINACNVAERFANREATQEEMAAARDAARDAAWAAGDAAWAAAGDAAWAAAWDATGAAAWAATGAARDAAWAATGAARDAAKDAQIDKLLTYFE
jgi:hypothetical protein